MSIRPKHVRDILAGRKTVEFRRRGFGREVTRVVIYATHPVQRVVGWFRVDYVSEGRPQGAWKIFGASGAISREEFAAYFDGSEHAVAIGISGVTRVGPLALGTLGRRLRAPQSYLYLTNSEVARLDAVAKQHFN